MIYDYDVQLHKKWGLERRANEAKELLRVYSASRSLTPSYIWKRKGKRGEKRIRIELQESPKKSLLEALEDTRSMLEKFKKEG